MKIGIVGHGAEKFTPVTEKAAKDFIRTLMTSAPGDTYVSGHSPMGGIDIWTEEIGAELGVKLDIKAPKVATWDDKRGGYGYKARNLDIAKADVVFVLVVDEYPPGYDGMVFDTCYHCEKHNVDASHVKSGGCWTGWRAKHAFWFVISPTGDVRDNFNSQKTLSSYDIKEGEEK